VTKWLIVIGGLFSLTGDGATLGKAPSVGAAALGSAPGGGRAHTTALT